MRVGVSVPGDVFPPEHVPELCDLVDQPPVLPGFFEPVPDVRQVVGEAVQRVAFQHRQQGDVGVQGPDVAFCPGEEAGVIPAVGDQAEEPDAVAQDERTP